ncbi:F-ATPase family transporter: protons (vacuolar) [Ostreococcus lucimarinus CCE9901]|uniref:F-ATPase family transporter: protons (Vacuolar) n=1 Tax=Ostreococcus lucimarinus (strain CCE9901) TaxID=436017 RepID=A4S0A8_OSTLU|nr:F-ATPase family transporter: protons (vacuolar) [Ostreococcus lucimarinus CCE9901]ABO97007.1 F-ATPase family transporter: protons (vacuolar) [Ostreococcus lucimarinus CCE9901]|eukprot:XP_001418714.1 F-ATPase family transporter: protons (vacuolar) [Ostreococcus lucimarinus CCE9901]
MGFWFTTLAFAALEGVFYAYVQGSAPAARRSFLHVMYGTSVFCCWFMWAVIYMAQMTPLVRPVLQAKES